MKIIILSIIMTLSTAVAGFAEYYKYRDENGILRFSDTLPGKYADRAEACRESFSSPQDHVKPPPPVRETIPIPPGTRKQRVSAHKETRIIIRKDRILIPVEIVGTRGSAKLNLMMDTGAQRTFLWRSALPSIGLRKVGRVRAAGIAGSKYASSVRVKSLNVGPYRLQNAVITLMNPGRYNTGYDGLLGMDFLMKVKYEIDYNRSAIIWKGVN